MGLPIANCHHGRAFGPSVIEPTTGLFQNAMRFGRVILSAAGMSFDTGGVVPQAQPIDSKPSRAISPYTHLPKAQKSIQTYEGMVTTGLPLLFWLDRQNTSHHIGLKNQQNARHAQYSRTHRSISRLIRSDRSRTRQVDQVCALPGCRFGCRSCSRRLASG